VANKPKKSGSTAGADRRARVEELKRQQQAQERKKTLLLALIGIGVAAVLIVPSSLVLVHRNHQKHRDPATVGVSAAAAQCDAVKIDPATGGQDHVDAKTHVDYATVPPSSGRHFQFPADVNERGFYTTKDTPTVEQLVHNLEHGYTIVWYDPKIASWRPGTSPAGRSPPTARSPCRTGAAPPTRRSRPRRTATGSSAAGRPVRRSSSS
jgi:hypothetical protein